MTAGFDCEAYRSPIARDRGWCFFSDPELMRKCVSQQVCHEKMVAERQRAYDNIQTLAAQGNTLMTALAAKITHPEQLLGGSRSASKRRADDD